MTGIHEQLIRQWGKSCVYRPAGTPIETWPVKTYAKTPAKAWKKDKSNRGIETVYDAQQLDAAVRARGKQHDQSECGEHAPRTALARECGISVTEFNRRAKALGITPTQPTVVRSGSRRHPTELFPRSALPGIKGLGGWSLVKGPNGKPVAIDTAPANGHAATMPAPAPEQRETAAPADGSYPRFKGLNCRDLWQSERHCFKSAKDLTKGYYISDATIRVQSAAGKIRTVVISKRKAAYYSPDVQAENANKAREGKT